MSVTLRDEGSLLPLAEMLTALACSAGVDVLSMTDIVVGVSLAVISLSSIPLSFRRGKLYKVTTYR